MKRKFDGIDSAERELEEKLLDLREIVDMNGAPYSELGFDFYGEAGGNEVEYRYARKEEEIRSLLRRVLHKAKIYRSLFEEEN